MRSGTSSSSGNLPEPAEYPGSVEESDIAEDYAEHCLGFINTEDLRPLKIVIDAGNGMAGKMLPPIFEKLPFEYVPMYFELDGSFPNHPPNPIEPENMEELQERVKSPRGRISASRSTATRTGASSWTRRE